jgi:hypothetical protein
VELAGYYAHGHYALAKRMGQAKRENFYFFILPARKE